MVQSVVRSISRFFTTTLDTEWLWDSTSLLLYGYWDLFPEVKKWFMFETDE